MPTNRPPSFPYTARDPAAEPALAVETERLRQGLRQQPASEIAALAGGHWTERESGGWLELEFWGQPVRLDFPELIARRPDGAPLPLPVQALLVYYLATSDGTRASGNWVSFADLPGGRTYAQAFQGYSGSVLARAFGEDLDALRQACLSAGGKPLEFGDAAYTFLALPHLPLLVTYWQGEEDLPSDSKVLFDATATHHLPVDVCAILGSMLVSRILKARPTQPAG